MRICGLEKLSLVDYPGLSSAVVFTSGCNFLCPFCHNSGLVYNNQPEILEQDVVEYLKKRAGLLDAVVISGGEPTLQKDLFEFIRKVKEMGYKVKLDTNGTNPEILKTLIKEKLVDYVAMDVKNSLSEYSKITNIKNINTANIIASIDILKQNSVDYEFRTTLVAEFHSEKSIKEMAGMIKGAKNVVLQRFEDRESCIARGLTPVSKEFVEEFKNILNQEVGNVTLRGY